LLVNAQQWRVGGQCGGVVATRTGSIFASKLTGMTRTIAGAARLVSGSSAGSHAGAAISVSGGTGNQLGGSVVVSSVSRYLAVS
jgi:hypothetical protein